MTAKPADRTPAMPSFDYVREPDAIYDASFAAIAHAADLSFLPDDMAGVAARMVHACGLPEIIASLVFSKGAGRVGRAALAGGAPIFVDAEMVASGIIRARLPAKNAVICTLNDAGIREEARGRSETRSSVAVEHWGEKLAGAVVVIGNAPTALFRLLEMLQANAPLSDFRPALIIGLPVGFVGAAESKEALITHAGPVPFITLRGRFGGSAVAAAALNALSEAAPHNMSGD